MKGLKCPFFKRRVGAYNWKGIKCVSDKYPEYTLGNTMVRGWSEEERERKIKEFCHGDYKNCNMYKNHTS